MRGDWELHALCICSAMQGSIDGETAGALAVVLRWAEGALRVMQRARVNMVTVASNDSKGALFPGAITLVFGNLF